MIWLLTRPVVWPVKTSRVIGYRRLTVFGLGVAVGLLVAPTPGRELRDKLRERLAPEPPLPLPSGTSGPYPALVPDPAAADLLD